MRRIVLLVVAASGLVAGLVGITASPAAAHAVLQATSPGDGAALDEAPAEVTLEFSEAVSAPRGALQVVDAGGEQVDDGAVEVAGTSVRVGLDDGLGDGAYIASYRVVSADGHPIQGAFSFTVGDADPVDPSSVAAAGHGDDQAAEVAAGVARWLAYLGALLAAGGAIHRLTVDGETTGPWVQARLVRIACLVGTVGLLATLPINAHLATGDGLGALFEDGVARVVLGDGVGWAAAVTIAGLVVLAFAAGAAAPVPLVAGAVLAVVGFALTGHTNTSDPRWLVTGADAVHLGAAAVWFGGIVLLVRSLLGRGRPADAVPAGRMVARFSSVAGVSIVVVGVAGVALSWSEVRSVSNLTSTGYGRLLLVKVAIVAAIAAAAAYNRFRLVPILESAGPSAWSRLRRTVGFEAVAMVAVLAVTAALVNVTPARAEVTGPASVTVPFGEGPFADGNLNVVVDPASAGTTQMHLYVLEPSGRPTDQPIDELTVELSLPSSGIGPIRREPSVAGPGHYQLDGNDFAVPGRWEIEVIARIDTFEQVRATIEVTLRP